MAFIEEDSVKITVVAVGKLKERFWADACAEYVKRLSAYASIKMVEIPDRDPAKTGGEEAGRALEARPFWRRFPSGRMWCCSTLGARSVRVRRSRRI